MRNLKARRTLLVIDDDMLFCDTVKEVFGKDNIEVLSANTGGAGVAECTRKKVDVVLLDQNLPDMKGHECCTDILKHNEQAKIIFITAFPSYKSAVEAIRSGAHDYLSKPFELEELRLAVERCIRTLELEDLEHLEKFKDDKCRELFTFVGSSPEFLDLRKMLDLAAGEDAPVLITGETGTGKTVAAKYIHYYGSKKNGPFVFVNCGALPETLIESELFGYEKGAFTNAASTRRGVFELADGGTLLLDEIGAMPMHLQSKLLGVLEEKSIRRLGGEAMRGVNVRIIAATNTDLEEAVRKKAFRDDLYYRLGVIRVHMPPLRERPVDIAELCRIFLDGIPARRHAAIPEEELDRLKEYGWPGNVRELRNILERACILQKGDVIRPSQLLGRSGKPETDKHPNGKVFSVPTDRLPSLEEVEDGYIRYVFEALSGNFTRTANALGISRSTLKRKLGVDGSEDV